jgi:hypothetical protein
VGISAAVLRATGEEVEADGDDPLLDSVPYVSPTVAFAAGLV